MTKQYFNDKTGWWRVGEIVNIGPERYRIFDAIPYQCDPSKCTYYITPTRADPDGPFQPMTPRAKHNHPAGHRWK